MHAAPAVEAQHVRFSYRSARTGQIVNALQDVSFDVQAGEFLSIVGPSGSGKSTLLHLIASLLAPDAGQIRHAQAGPKRIGYLFQNDAAFPWRTVERNLAYIFELRGLQEPERRQRAKQLCELVGLEPEQYLHRYPRELSGGQLRRVGLGMALADSPGLLLLDEPTSAADWLTRRQLQSMIQDVVTRTRTTVVAVTHDVEEAVWLSDRILSLRNGRIEKSIDVPLSRPRTDATRKHESFQRIEDEVVLALAAGIPDASGDSGAQG